MNCNTTHYRANSSSVPGDPTEADAHGTGDIFIHPLNDLYIPSGMIVLGTIFSYIVMTAFYNLHAGTAMLSVGVMTILNVALVIPAVMITVKMFDLGIGPIGPGLLKIAACAVAPGALGDLIGKVIIGGGVGSYIGWTIAYITTIIIFMKLLEMDWIEMNVCAVIIFLQQAFVGYALMFALLNGVGISGLPAGGFGLGTMGSGGRVMLSGEAEHDEDDGLDSIRARQSDEASTSMLMRGGIDAKEWMQKSPDGILAKKTHDQSVRILRGFYDSGALEIRVYPDKNAKNVDIVNYFIVIPPRPDAPNAKPVRDKVLKELKVLAKDLGRATPRDRGEKYFPVRMLTGDEEDKELNNSITPGPAFTPGKKPADDDDDDDN